MPIKTTHTPGPWEVYETRDGAMHVGTRHAGISHLVVCDMPLPGPHRDANARLIAETPTLLAILRQALPLLEDAATEEEAQSNRAPTGLPPVKVARELWERARALLARREGK